jgi:hypothetical protein
MMTHFEPGTTYKFSSQVKAHNRLDRTVKLRYVGEVQAQVRMHMFRLVRSGALETFTVPQIKDHKIEEVA